MQRLYKQEAELVPLTSWPWLLSARSLPFDGVEDGMGKIGIYFKGEYGIAYFNEDALCHVAEVMYDRYRVNGALECLYDKFKDKTDALIAIYMNHNRKTVLMYDAGSLRRFVACLIEAYRNFWQYSFFIDSYDAGYDQEVIDYLSSVHSLTPMETAILLAPDQHNYLNERRLKFLEIAREISFQPGLTVREQAQAALTRYRNDWKEYMKKYAYYKSNYAHVREITREEIVDELVQYLGNAAKCSDEYKKLRSYSAIQQRNVEEVLVRRGLGENPYFFFKKMICWRDQRKKINLMGVHVFEWIAEWLERRMGDERKYIKYLTYEELFEAIEGAVYGDELRRRRDGGVAYAPN